MFENIINFFKRNTKKDKNVSNNSKDTAKERLHLVLMQDRANVSVDFLELMKQEIIDVIKKYIDVDESAIDVRLTNKENEDGTNGAPALYANIPIINIKNDARKVDSKEQKEDSVNKNDEKNETIQQDEKNEQTSKTTEQPQEEEKTIEEKENEKEENSNIKEEIIIENNENKQEEEKKDKEENKV